MATWLTIEEAPQHLKIGRSTLYPMPCDDKVAAHTVGRASRLDREVRDRTRNGSPDLSACIERRDTTTLSERAQAGALDPIIQGPGTLLLDWEPAAGGTMHSYIVERREANKQGAFGDWDQVGVALETELQLTNQPRANSLNTESWALTPAATASAAAQRPWCCEASAEQ